MDGWKRKFSIIWIGQAVSILTSSVLQMAIVWYLTQKTASAAVLSTATLVGYVPQAVLGIFVGVYIDKYSRKMIMIVSDLAIAATGLFLVFASIQGEVSVGMIMVVLFVRSVGTAFHQPSLQAVTPLIVPKERITQCVGFSQSFESVAMLASPAIAGVLFGIFDLNVIILLDACGAVFAVIMLCFVKIPRSKHATEKAELHVFQGVKEGILVLKKKKGLTSLLVISALYAVIYFPIGTLYPLITIDYFGGTVLQSSFVEIIFSAGMLLGSLTLGVFGGKIKKSFAMFLSMLIYGLALSAEGMLPPGGLLIFTVVTALLGLTVPFYTGIEMAILQTKVEDEFRGRVLSLSSSITMMAMPIGLILSGTFAGLIGVNKWFLLSGIASIILAGVLRCLPSVRACCDNP